MWIAFYNRNGIGDVLLLTKESGDSDHIDTESNGNITLIKNTLTNEVISVNIFNISEALTIEGNGHISLTEEQMKIVQQLIVDAGFKVEVKLDNRPKFVVGYVEESEKLEDSDHLSVTQTNVGDETLQIVCGANNIAAGQHVIVARNGAVLPNGAIIWDGELRGTASYGMICSTRELGLTNLEDLPGIWELNQAFDPGTPLTDVVASYQ